MGRETAILKVDNFAATSDLRVMMPFAIPFPPFSPELYSFEIGGFTLALRWYALSYIAGLIFAWWLAKRLVQRPALWPVGQAPMTAAQVEDIMTWMILGVIIGGRLGFVLFYQPGYYLAHPLEILMVWQGGMAFHGGFLGVVVAAWIYARKHGLPLASTADLIAMVVAPGLMLGRLANFINAELWGRPTDVPWGVIFPGEAAQVCATALEPCVRHPSQLYQATLEGALLFAILLWLGLRRGALQAPWRVTGVFFLGYGLARMVVELFRQPDEQFTSLTNPVGYALQLGQGGLTMGQILSVPMVLLGLYLILRSKR